MPEQTAPSLLSSIGDMQDKALYAKLHQTYSFDQYLALVRQNPRITRNAHQRLHDLIVEPGTMEYMDNKKKITSYNFFKDPNGNGDDAIFGLDIYLMKLVNVLHSAALGFGSQSRLLVLFGGVGSSKSSIARLFKRGVERYSMTDTGALYSFDWINLKKFRLNGDEDEFKSPMNEEPLKLIPLEWREKAIEKMGLSSKDFAVSVPKELDPLSNFFMQELMKRYNGDWTKVVSEHIRVKRIVLSERHAIGVGTFEPKDEKNQDSTELTGDINYRRLAEFGLETDPRVFDFNGELNRANRGILEMIEIFKLDVAFLYTLLGATAEHEVKPKRFSLTPIDEVIIGHTNEEEYLRIINDKTMKALIDRSISIKIPYPTKLSAEKCVYTKGLNEKKVKGVHIAPHTIEVAAMFAVLSRLEDPKKHNLSLLQKMKLYDGKQIPGYTSDTVKELRKDTENEGMTGISPRYIQDKLSNALVVGGPEGYIDPFMVLNELEKGLDSHALINNNKEVKGRLIEIIEMVKREYEEIVKNEVQRAISADEDAIARLCSNYLDQVKAFLNKEKVKSKYDNRPQEPDERLMRSIEEKIEIPANRAHDFRSELFNHLGSLALENKKFEWSTNDRLRKALEMKLFEDQKDTIKLKSLVSNVIDAETQEKIDIIRTRLIKNFGYNVRSASNVLEYVASIFARGDTKE